MKPTQPKWKFEVYLARRSSPFYVLVCVHKDLKSLQLSRQKKDGTVEAFFRPTSIEEVLTIGKDGSEKRNVNHCFGEAHFYPGSLSFNIITHEMFHAVTCWAWEHGCLPEGNESDRKKSTVFDIPSNEELCAEMIGELVGQTMVGLKQIMGKKFLMAEAKW